MNKLNKLTAVVLASSILALGAVHALGLFPRLTSSLSPANTPVSVISFEEQAVEAIRPSPAVLAVVSTPEP